VVDSVGVGVLTPQNYSSSSSSCSMWAYTAIVPPQPPSISKPLTHVLDFDAADGDSPSRA
jgi:hypothetical protein